MHFHQMTADELFLARLGQIAAREGAPLDETQSEPWKAGWMLSAGADFIPRKPRWVVELSEALMPAREVEFA